MLSGVLWSVERYDEALEAAEKAAEMDPDDQDYADRLEELHAALAERERLR